ncbi:hypothetical protein TNCV_2416911 [Trichonephila clavipes]|nr:hypothetical protein TNCV_2416911 [Trichonephila clavipes]
MMSPSSSIGKRSVDLAGQAYSPTEGTLRAFTARLMFRKELRNLKEQSLTNHPGRGCKPMSQDAITEVATVITGGPQGNIVGTYNSAEYSSRYVLYGRREC